ncbi:hypothetical protein D3C75_943530 [compost metagenome]
MTRAGIGIEYIVGRTPHAIRASTDGVVHFERHSTAGSETAGSNDGSAARCVVFKVGGDGRNVGKSPVVVDG